MRQAIITLSLLLLQVSSEAQAPSNRQSMLAELPSLKNGRGKVDLLNKLAFSFFKDKMPDQGILYGKQALSLASELQIKNAINEANLCIGLCYDLKSDTKATQEYLIGKVDTINIPGNAELYKASLNWIGNFYGGKEKYPEALKYCLHLLAFLEKKGMKADLPNTSAFIADIYKVQNDLPHAIKYWLYSANVRKDPDPLLGNLFFNIGLGYDFQNDDTRSLIFFEKGISASRRSGNMKMEAMNLLFAGRSYHFDKNDYQKARVFYNNAITLHERLGSKADIAVAMNNIAGSYVPEGNYTKALDYYLQSLKISEELNNSDLMVANYNDLCLVYKADRNYPEALRLLFAAKQILEREDKQASIPTVLGNIGTIYLAQGKTDSALHYLGQSLGLSGDSSVMSTIATLNNLSFFYGTNKKYSRVIEVLHSSLQLSRQINDSALTALAYLNLGKSYLEMATEKSRVDWPDSLRKLPADLIADRAISFLTTSLVFYQRKKMAEMLQENYRLLAEAEKINGDPAAAFEYLKKYIFYRDEVFNIDKVREREETRFRYELDKKEALARARMKTWIIAGAGILIILLMAFYFYSKIKDNRFKLKLAALRQEALNAQMSDHFIGNAMNSINGFIQDNEKVKAGEYLNMFRHLIRKVLENASEKTIPLSDDIEVLTTYFELEKLRFIKGALEYDIVIDETIDPELALVPPMVLQVLAENSIKHGLTKIGGGKVTIGISKRGNVIECTVTDNGIGRKAASEDKHSGKDEVSFGMPLAERLLRTAGKSKSAITFSVVDLTDTNNNPAGTAVKFTLPYIQAN